MNCEAMTKRLGMTFSNARRWLVAALWVLAGAGGGCAPEGTRPQTVGAELGAGSYERWAASLPREPESGLAIVDTDLVVGSDRLLRDYYLRYVSPNRKGGLIVDQVNGRDDLWPASRTHDLTYCVSNTFGAAKARVVAGLRDAAASWQGAADVGYRYVPAEDAACDARNPRVVFDVRPTSSTVFLARSFFPKTPRSGRSVLIAKRAFVVSGTWTLAGILRHELGHALGLRHEHTRPEAHACYEDSSWRPVTAYDRASVMHYPQCNGSGDWDGSLTLYDRAGIAALYGPPRR